MTKIVPSVSVSYASNGSSAKSNALGMRPMQERAYERRGEQFWDPENTTARSALNLVNARAGFEANDGSWALTASVDNLTDEVYNSEWVLGGFANAGVPRLWRVDLRVNF